MQTCAASANFHAFLQNQRLKCFNANRARVRRGGKTPPFQSFVPGTRKSMNEAETRADYIDPPLKAAGGCMTIATGDT
jgi:hypothetical protein